MTINQYKYIQVFISFFFFFLEADQTTTALLSRLVIRVFYVYNYGGRLN